jgi:hypothetical protein
MATSVHPFLMMMATLGAEGLGEGDQRTSWETPLTFIVQGVILTGRVISQKKYNDLLLESMRNATAVGEGGHAAWQGVVGGLEKVLAKEDPDAVSPDPFLYLADVSINNITRGSQIRRTTWCVRLSDVSAVMLGAPSDD